MIGSDPQIQSVSKNVIIFSRHLIRNFIANIWKCIRNDIFMEVFREPKNTYKIAQEKRPKWQAILQKNISSGLIWRKIVTVKQKYWAKSKNGG